MRAARTAAELPERLLGAWRSNRPSAGLLPDFASLLPAFCPPYGPRRGVPPKPPLNITILEPASLKTSEPDELGDWRLQDLRLAGCRIEG